MKKITFLLVAMVFSFYAFSAKPSRDFYLIQIYHCTNQQQIVNLNAYLKDTYLPFLHQQGIAKVGVFEPIENDTAADKKLMVWVPLGSLANLDKIDAAIEQIDPLGNNPIIHPESNSNELPYTRVETILSKSFKNQAQFEKKSNLTPSPDRIYEFRSYEGPNEAMFLKKVHMFNEGKEIELFKKLNFNAIFYAKVIAGSRMPNLIYMTSFNNLEDRNTHWKTFSDDPTWKHISNLPIYLKTISKADIILMKAKDYADF